MTRPPLPRRAVLGGLLTGALDALPPALRSIAPRAGAPWPGRAAGLGIGLATARPAGAAPRLRERPLGETAVIGVPANLDPSTYAGHADEGHHRLVFQFARPDFWGSLGGVARYQQLLLVSVLAADAPEAAATARPRGLPVSYERRGPPRTQPLGSGQLTVTEASYALGVDLVPAVEYLYQDRARQLQILWHALRSKHDAAAAPALIARMAEGFRLLQDPAPILAERRAEPAREAAARERNRATVQATLQREGYGQPVPGQPIWRRGAWLERMVEPEPRVQLLSPLGRIRLAPGAGVANRPRPLPAGSASPDANAGIGWREHLDGEWRFHNRDHGYLPLPGIAARLAAHQRDPGWVYFYFAQTVRIDEEPDASRLQTLEPFFSQLPELQRRWREGRLAGPGEPQDDDWPR